MENKNIIITGGSSGIGKATAYMAREEGSTIGIISNSQTELDVLPEEFYKYLADIRDPVQATQAVDSFNTETGGVDMLVNSAGVSLWKEIRFYIEYIKYVGG